MKKIFTLFAALMMAFSMSAVPYLKGTFNNWSESNSLASGSTTVTLNANATYEFKVHDGSNWYGNNGTMSSTNCTDWVMKTSDGNCKINTTIAGVYTFKWNSSAKKLSVVYPTEAVEINYYITGSANLVGGDGWTAKEIKMANNDGTYTHTFTALAAGKYEMKVTQGNWDNTLGFSNLATSYEGVTGNNDNNIIIDLVEATNLTVTVSGTTVSLSLPEKTNTIYFVNEKGWSKVNAYVWTDNPYKAWPGEAMTKVEGKTYGGKDVYTYTYPANNSKVIFNDGGSNQTSDLTYNEATPYYYNGKWNASIEYDKTEFAISATVNPAESGTVDGAGTYNKNASATLTATPAEGYEFVNWTVDGTEVSQDATYTFTVTKDLALVANFKLTPVYADITVTVNIPYTHSATPKIYWWGALGLEDAVWENAPEMTPSDWDPSQFSYTFKNVDTITGVNFLVISEGVQTRDLIAHADMRIWFASELQPVQIFGLGGKWEADAALTFEAASDCNTTSVIVPLEAAAVEEFKLMVNGEWKGSNTIALTAENNKASFADNGEGNAKLTASIKGGYKFTYSYLTKELTVTYPGEYTLDLGQLTAQYVLGGVYMEDENYNSITIYNQNEETEEYLYGDDFDVEVSIKHNGEWLTLTGKGSWNVVEGVLVFKGTNLVDENATVSYTVTATSLLPQEYTLNLTGSYEEETTEYYSSITYRATTADEKTLVIEVFVNEDETNINGYIGDDIYFTTIENLTVVDGENDTKTVTCVAADNAGNTYNITLVVSPFVAPKVVINNAVFNLNADGDLEISALYDGVEVFATIWSYNPTVTEYEYVSIYDKSWEFSWSAEVATVTKEGEVYTLTGLFRDDYTGMKYDLTVTSAPAQATGLGNVNTAVAPVKMIENGQLIIINNGVKYNVQGAIVK